MINNNYSAMLSPPTQQYIIPPQTESVVHINAEQEMINFPIAPGNTVYFINDSQNVFYKREVNIYGTQSLPEVYDFRKREQPVVGQQGANSLQTPVPQEYMTKKDVEDLILEILGKKEGGGGNA